MKTIYNLSILLLVISQVNAQSLSSISPTSGTNGQTLDVTISGVNTIFMHASSSINFDFSHTINSMEVVDNTTITANITIPEHTYTGNYSISVNSYNDGYLYLHNCFYVDGIARPELESVNPSSASAGQTLDVTITGANTHFITGSATLNFEFVQSSSTTIHSVDIVNSTTITANITIPEYTYTGNYDVYVYNSLDGYLSLYDAFYVNGIERPELSSINPSSATTGETLDVTIYGLNTHFTVGSTTLNFNSDAGGPSINYNSIDIRDNTTIEANITIPSYVSSGGYHIDIYNAIDGHLRLYSGLYVNNPSPPSLVSITPNYANKLETLDVTITGSNTVFGQGTTTLYFEFYQGTSTAIVNNLNIVNNNMLDANITIPYYSPSGVYDVIVYNSNNGYVTLNDGFTIGVTSIEDTEAISGFDMFPNPATDKIALTYLNDNDQHARIEFFDINGNVIFYKTITPGLTDIYLNDIPNGLYFIKLECAEHTFVKKLIKN